MLSSISKSGYWYAYITINTVYVVVLCIVLYSQYQYISQDTVPTDLSGFVDQTAWLVNSKESKSVLVAETVFAIVGQIIFVSLVGFSMLPRLWERVTTFCKAKVSDSFDSDMIASGIVYFMLLAIAFATQKLTNMIAGTSLTYFLLEFPSILMSIFVLVCMDNLRKYKLLVLPIIASALLCFHLFSNLVYPWFEYRGLDKLLNEENNSAYMNLLARVGFPADRVAILYGDAKSYISGWGWFTILLIGDQLRTRGFSSRICEAATAHQLAYWNYYFVLIKSACDYLVEIMKVFILFYIIDRPKFYQYFGFKDSKTVPIGIGLILYHLIFSQTRFLTAPIWNGIRWAMENQADSFASRLGYAQDLLQYIKSIDILLGPNSIATTLYGLFNIEFLVLADRIHSLKSL